jgi:hypothetical protein
MYDSAESAADADQQHGTARTEALSRPPSSRTAIGWTTTITIPFRASTAPYVPGPWPSGQYEDHGRPLAPGFILRRDLGVFAQARSIP